MSLIKSLYFCHAQLAVLLICCIVAGIAAELETKPTDAQAAAEAVLTTKLTPSVEEPKSKTEKRDSSDQTASGYISKPAKETPFRPIYPSTAYYEAADSGSIFGPTTVRYTAADAPPQSYYDKPESGSIRYVPPTAVEQKHASALVGLPGPLQFLQQQPHPQPQQQQQQLPPHRFRFAVPPQVELYQRPAAKSPASNSIYSYMESQPSLYERAGPQQYQLAATAAAPQQQVPLPGQRVQYIIAIPLSYMRQLQQQLGAGLLSAPPSTAASSTTSSSTASTTTAVPATAAAAASHPLMQVFGPLARDHQGMYRPYYQSDLVGAPSAVPTPVATYGQHYLQIPSNVLLAAAQQLQQQQQQQQQQHQHQQHHQTVYPKAAPTPASVYQPIIYQTQPKLQPQPQLHLQRVYQQTPTIYAEQPVGQQTTLFAYPLHQQQQQQQQQHQARLLRLGLKQAEQQHKYATVPTAGAPSASAPATTAATTTLVLPTAATHEQQQQQQQQQQHQALPLVHYNPIYVQAPAEQQHHQQQQQFAILPRFSNNNPKAAYNLAHESTPPIHVVRLTAANALGQQQPQPLHHYHTYQPALQHQQQHQHPQQEQFYQSHPGPLSSYAEEQQHSQSPAVIPYFSHPGAVHYGTHLYHPASAATAAAVSTKQQQQQQQQRLASATTATSGRLAGDKSPGGVGVKQATAAANIVKYP